MLGGKGGTIITSKGCCRLDIRGQDAVTRSADCLYELELLIRAGRVEVRAGKALWSSRVFWVDSDR